MTIVTIIVVDFLNPTEVQMWLLDNPSKTLLHMWSEGNAFYIVHE